jgi:hypothetical protein
VVALVAVLVLGTCVGVPSAGILSIVATNHEDVEGAPSEDPP